MNLLENRTLFYFLFADFKFYKNLNYGKSPQLGTRAPREVNFLPEAFSITLAMLSLTYFWCSLFIAAFVVLVGTDAQIFDGTLSSSNLSGNITASLITTLNSFGLDLVEAIIVRPLAPCWSKNFSVIFDG